MMREWFTIPELRAPGIKTFDGAYFNKLIHEYPGLSSSVARTRGYGLSPAHQLEFHVSLFLPMERMALQHFWLLRPTEDRIYKLGIHRAVDTSRDGVIQTGR